MHRLDGIVSKEKKLSIPLGFVFSLEHFSQAKCSREKNERAFPGSDCGGSRDWVYERQRNDESYFWQAQEIKRVTLF
jgi:hypothetical protein